jgi:(p)ppGpp synthase/HD superfamily hydrolase
LLHDTIEDTSVTYKKLVNKFGVKVADGVQALTKNFLLPKDKQLKDTIQRIKQQPKEIWIVKIADRITNLQEPPKFWGKSKIMRYRDEAIYIYDELRGVNDFIEKRFARKIEEYNVYII